MGYDKFEGLNQITDAYQKAVAKTILENELGYKEQTTGYELTHSIGNSGWSFGGYQLDISQRKQEGIALLKDIYNNQYGQNSWTVSIEVALKSTNSSLLSSADKLKIDNALSSDYGKEILNKDFTTELTKVTNHIDKIEIELQKIKPDLRLSDGEKLMLADFHNQFNLGFDITQSDSMLKKIEDYIRIKGDITPEGLVDLFKTTKQYKNNEDSQKSRIQRSYDAAKELDAQTNNNQSNNDAKFMEDELDKFAENDKTNLDDVELTADSGQIKTDVNYDQDSQTLFYEDENGNIQQITYENNSDLLIYGDTSNPDKITFTDENGDYQVWEKDSEGNFVQTNKVDYSGTLNTAINQIGSLIIMNNQAFSNVEKIVVSTSVATIADFATYKTKRKIL